MAKPFADPQLEVHSILRPGQVCQGAPIVTMDASGWGGAQRTGGVGLRRLHAQGDLRRGVIDLTRLEAQCGRIGQQTGQDGCGWCRDESRFLLPSMLAVRPWSARVPTAARWSHRVWKCIKYNRAGCQDIPECHITKRGQEPTNHVKPHKRTFLTAPFSHNTPRSNSIEER